MNKTIILAFLFSFIVLSANGSAYMNDWWGRVTINGVPAEDGTQVAVYSVSTDEFLDSTTVGEFTSGYYLLHVNLTVGEYVYFIVNGYAVVDQEPQQVTDEPVDHELDLSVTDQDQDGYSVGYEGYAGPYKDCNDSDPEVNPNASEICNGIDDNCNNQIDENVCQITYYCDSDGDGHYDKNPDGTCNTYNCVPEGCVDTQGDDCNDNNPNIHPGVLDFCDGIDNNCDGIDNGCGGGGGGFGGGAGGSISCTVNWTCTDWSECYPNGTQYRTCTDTNNCGTSYGKPEEERPCTYIQPSESRTCEENWTCTEWSECSPDGIQTRTCVDVNECGTEENKPEEERSCQYKPVTTESEGKESQQQGFDLVGYVINNPATFYGISLIIIFVIVIALYKKAKGPTGYQYKPQE